MENQIREFTKKGNRRRLFKRVVSLLCVVVLLFTMNTLKRNANTLERIAMCGLQEHTHTAGCYNSSGELVCAIPEHVHTDACYQQSPSDDLVLNGDDLEIADGLVDAGDTQSLDLSLDLDQGELLDFVQDSDAPASNVQDIGNDMPVLDGDLVFDTSYNNEETQQLAANTSVEEAQGAVDETQSEEAQQLLEEEQIAVEDGQDQPTGEGQEQISFEEDQEQPVEQPTEAAQEQPVEEETEQPVEEEQEQPVEEETEQPVEGEQFVEEDQDQIAIEEQPVVTGQEQPTEEVQEQLVIEEQEEPVVEAQEEPVVEEQGEPVVEEQEEPVIEEQEEPVIKEQEEPVVEEQEEPVVEEQEEPVVEEQEEPVVEEQEEPAVEEQEEPVVEEQEEPAVEEQEEPVVEEQEEPVVEEQEEPVVEEQEEPVVEEQEEPVVEEQEEPVVEKQEEPAVEEQEEPVVEEQEEPAVEEQEEPAIEEQEEPAIEAAEQPAEEEAEQPAEEEAEQPAEEEAEQPAEEEAEQPAEEEAEQPTEEEAEQPAEENAEQPAEEEAEQPTEEEAEQPAEEEAEQPTEEEAEQPAEEETEEPAIEEAEQPAEVESDPEAEGESEEEPEARIAYPAKQFRQGTAYINVSVDAPEGAFPEGTVMVVKDVEDQGTIDNIQQSVAEDFVEVTSVHAVDISFWYNDAEIEPLLPIAVVMSAVEAPNADHETVVVHVDDNGETQLVDSEATGAAEAALEMPAAADAEAQAFEADTFSVYALVTKQVIETKYIDDHGDTWRIKVDYGKDAKLPEGASLQVSEVTDDTYLAQAEAALESGKRITKARFFDIKIMDGDREVQPDGQVKVTVTLEGDEGEVEAAENQNDIGNPDVVAMHFVEQDDETVSVEKQSAVETDEGVVFNADGFSAWGVIYTVDFEVEGDQGEITLDFTAFDATTLPEEGEIYYDTEDCSVHVALGLLTRIIGSEAKAGYDIDVNAALVDNYEFDFDKAEMGKSDSGMRFEDGELIIASDGFVELTEGERLLRVRATGLTALKQALLETEGVSIEVISGNVPLGSEASYTAHTDEETAELVENYINNEENGDVAVAGYSAADLKIVRNDETLPVEGQFKVTVDKASLVPVGMKLDKLYHIHRDENDEAVVEELAVEETEAGLVFEVANFSDIVAGYTVDFEYNGYKWSFPGLGSYSIASIMEEIGVEGEITYVSLKCVEGEEVEGALYLEQKEDGWYLTSDVAFDETYELIVVVDGSAYGITVTDAQGTLTTTIKFFAKDAEIIKKDQDPNFPQPHINGLQEAPTNPALQSHYYVLAILKNKNGNELGWAIQDIDTPSSDSTQTYFSEFNAFEGQGEGETAEQYAARRGQSIDSKILYDTESNEITLRLYRADQALSTVNYQELVTNSATNSTYETPEEGYEFGGSFVKDNKTEAEIHLKKANNKKYKVRIYLDENAKDDIATSDNYYLYLKVNHASGDPSHYYVKLDISAATVKGNYVEFEFPHWMDNNGNMKTATSSNNTFTGNEQSIEVKLLKYDGDFKPNNYTNATVNEEGSAIKAYKVHYDTAATNPKTSTTGYYEEEETVDGKTVINCIDKVELQTIDAEGKYNYASILGPNLNYGIVADHLYHENHLQTNFAVNHYTGHGHDARPDLSGSSGGQIVIGEYNTIVSDFWTNGPVNGVGEAVTTVDIAGQLKIGNPLTNTLVVYADDNSGAPGALGTDDAKVRGTLDKVVVIQTDGAELSTNIVEPALHYMDRMSAELAAQPATFAPAIPSNGKLTIDTTAFPDDATIFIDADPIKNFIGSAGDLIIEKKPNQTIIFNFKETHTKSEEITLAQFVVKQEGFPAEGYTTHSPVGTGDPQNEYMDAIARHIVWNLYGVEGKAIIDISGGIYLQPNENSVIDVKGTTAGWIVSEGLVSNGSGEWHNVFAEMPDTSSVKLDAYKTVDGKQPRASQKFNFFLDEYDTSADGNWKSIYNNITNTTGSISFPEIKNLTTGWHVYRITEDQVKPTDTNGYFIMDGDSYYAVVNVKTTTTQTGQAATIVSTPVYYRNFDPDAFDPYSENLTGFSNTDKVGTVTFDNEEITDGLNILKKVQGTTANDIVFTFKVELWFEDTGSVQPYVQTGDTAETLTMTTATGTAPFVLSAENNVDNHSVGYVTLKAGELVNIQGIDVNAHYRITETKVNGQDIEDGATYVNGYKRLTAEQTGNMFTGLARAVFENEYKAFGTLDLKAHKTLTDKTGQEKQLAANSFAFRLAGHNAVNPTDWIWNNAEGKVSFPTINYSSADMEDAVPDPSNDNKLTKTLIYTVHENHKLGTGANNLAAQNVTYDDDKTVTVTLVDNGDGTITATASIDGEPLTDLTVEFNNTYEYQVPKGFEGTKVLTGRDMEDQEFWFNAVLTKYYDGTTEITYADDTAREAVDFVSATKVEGTNRANGNIVFPVITFKKAGTYTFTVTEDETRLPDDVEPTTPGQSYDVTIVVTEGTDSTTNEKILVAGEPTYTNDKTINNNQKKMGFTVTKDWFDAAGTQVFEGHTITFSVTKDGAAFPVTAEHIEKVGTSSTDGSYTVNSDGTVTLTAGAEAWPTVRLKDLVYPTTGYAVSETAHTGEAEGNFVNTTYRLNAGDYQAASPAVKVNDDALKIKNNETNTGLHVTKKWVASDGETDISKTVDQDVIYFAIKYDQYGTGYYTERQYNYALDNMRTEGLDGNNGDRVTDLNATDSTGNNRVVKIFSISRGSDGKWSTVAIDKLHISPLGWGSQALSYSVVEVERNANDLWQEVTSGVSYAINGINGSTIEIDTTTGDIADDSQGRMVITNQVEPTGIQVVKKWVGPKTDSVQVELWRKSSGGIDHTQAGDDLVPVYVSVNNVETLYGYYGIGDSMTMSVSRIVRADWGNSWYPTFYVKYWDTVSNPGWHHYETIANGDSGGAESVAFVIPETLKMKIEINESNNIEPISYELVDNSDSNTSIDSDPNGEKVTQKGITNPVTLNAANSWFYEWTNLDSGYLYFVKEQNTPGYVTTYTNNDGIKKGIITVTNTKTEEEKGALTITKQVTVKGAEVMDHSKASLADGTYTFTVTGPGNYSYTGSITVTNGVAQSSIELTGLTPGKYIVTEDTVDNHTTLTGRNGDGTGTDGERGIKLNVAAGDLASANVAAFTNNVNTGEATVPDSVTVNKQDNAGKPLAGATFTLYRDADCNTRVKAFAMDTDTSFTISTEDSDLSSLLPNTDGGSVTLYLKETEAPTGYLPSNTVYDVVISTSITAPQWNEEQGKYITTTTYTMTIDNGESEDVPNTPKTGSVTFTQKKIFTHGSEDTQFGYTVTEYTDSSYGAVKSTITNTGTMSQKTSGVTTVNYTLADVGHHYYIVKENLPNSVTPTAEDEKNGYIIHNGVKYDLREYKYDVVVAIGDTALDVKKDAVTVSDIESTFTNEQLGELEITKNIEAQRNEDRTGTFWYAVFKAEDVEEVVSGGNTTRQPKSGTHTVRTGSIVVTTDGTETVTEDDLPYGEYYVFELAEAPTTVNDTSENLKIILGGDQVIASKVYTVTGSGTTAATVDATAGSATLTNTVPDKDFHFTKEWWISGSSAKQDNWPGSVTIPSFTLERILVYNENGTEHSTTVDSNFSVVFSEVGKEAVDKEPDASSKLDDFTNIRLNRKGTGNDFTYTVSKLPKYGSMTVNGTVRVGEWKYRVREAQVSGYNAPVYLTSNHENTNNQYADDNGIIQNNMITVALPATGGVGTGVVYGAGAALVLLAVLGMILTKRKRTDGEGIR